MGYSPWGCKESGHDLVTKLQHFTHTHTHTYIHTYFLRFFSLIVYYRIEFHMLYSRILFIYFII